MIFFSLVVLYDLFSYVLFNYWDKKNMLKLTV